MLYAYHAWARYPYQCKLYRKKIMASQRVRWNLFSFICHICIQMDFHYGWIPCISTRTLALGQCTALIFIALCMWIGNGIHSLVHSVRWTALYICNISLNENADDRLHFHSHHFFLSFLFFFLLIRTVGRFENKYFQEFFIRIFWSRCEML